MPGDEVAAAHSWLAPAKDAAPAVQPVHASGWPTAAPRWVEPGEEEETLETAPWLPPYGLGWAPPGTYAPPRPVEAGAPWAAVAEVPRSAGDSFGMASSLEPPAAALALHAGVPDVGPEPPPQPTGRPIEKPASRWPGIISLGVLFAVVVVVGGVLLVALAPRLFGWQFVPVGGGSMEPAIRGGSAAVVRDVPPADLRSGNIITFDDPARPGHRVTHRIVAVNENHDEFTTRGDANVANDPAAVPARLVEGRLVFTIPAAGGVATWLDARYRFIGTVATLAGIMVLWELWSFARGRRKARALAT